MPLPSGGSWPPRPYDTALEQMATWDAWYVGDPATLASQYGQGGGVRAAGTTGGLVGAVARMFWGRPTSGGQSNTRLHMPVASDLCRTSAQLLFAEPPMFHAPGSNDATKKIVDQVMNTPAAQSSLIESAEIGAALGGSFLRLVWDTDVADHVMREAVDADRAIPEFRWGQLVAVTFWSELVDPVNKDSGRVWRHLEKHEKGMIFHGLYVGTSSKLGQPHPLEEHPDTVVYAALVNEESGIETGVDGLTAAYVPNVSPNPAWRKTPGLRPLGRSDFAPGGVISLMDFIDETWSSLARDVRLAKGRLVVPAYALKSLGIGQGSAFDLDQEVFAPVNTPPSTDGRADITAHQFDIRVEEHLGTINAALREILRAVGYSPLTMGLPDEVAATATEIHAREKDSLQTRGAKIRHYNAGLVPLSVTQMELEAAVFGRQITMPDGVKLAWPDGARESLLVRAQAVQALQAAQAASTETRVKIMQPDLDDIDRSKEVERIMLENSMVVDVPSTPDLPTTVDPSEIKSKADAMGVLIRSGVEPTEAAKQVGLEGLDFTGAVPTSLRLPTAEASGLEQA